MPAQHFWDPDNLRKLPGAVIADDRPGAPAGNVFWAGNLGEAGQVLHGYQSLWLPVTLLSRRPATTSERRLVCKQPQMEMSLHFNKGLAGAPADAVVAAERRR